MLARILAASVAWMATALPVGAEPVIFDNSDGTFVWPMVPHGQAPGVGDFLDITRPPDAQAGTTSGIAYIVQGNVEKYLFGLQQVDPTPDVRALHWQHIVAPLPWDLFYSIPTPFVAGEEVGPDAEKLGLGLFLEGQTTLALQSPVIYGSNEDEELYMDDEQFMAFELDIAGRAHYGFVQFRVIVDQSEEFVGFQPLSWGFEDEPGAPIVMPGPPQDPPSCPPDLTGDGVLNIFDFVAFADAFGAGETVADCDGNGMFNVVDFVCYHEVFQAGCDGEGRRPPR